MALEAHTNTRVRTFLAGVGKHIPIRRNVRERTKTCDSTEHEAGNARPTALRTSKNSQMQSESPPSGLEARTVDANPTVTRVCNTGLCTKNQ